MSIILCFGLRRRGLNYSRSARGHNRPRVAHKAVNGMAQGAMYATVHRIYCRQRKNDGTVRRPPLAD